MRLYDGQRRERPAALFVGEARSAFQEPAVQIEDISRVGFAARGAAQQQRDLAVGPTMLGEVVVNDQSILALGHELLADGATRVGREELQRCGLRSGRGYNDRVFHGPVFLQHADELCDFGGLLADCHVNARDVLSLLVDDRVDGDHRLARRAVADDELALATPDGRHGVDRLDTGLDWRVHALALGDVGRDALDRPGLVCVDWPFAIDWVAHGVDHTPDQRLSHGHFGDSSGRVNLVALTDVAVVTEDHDTDVLFLKVERQADYA